MTMTDLSQSKQQQPNRDTSQLWSGFRELPTGGIGLTASLTLAGLAVVGLVIEYGSIQLRAAPESLTWYTTQPGIFISILVAILTLTCGNLYRRVRTLEALNAQSREQSDEVIQAVNAAQDAAAAAAESAQAADMTAQVAGGAVNATEDAITVLEEMAGRDDETHKSWKDRGRWKSKQPASGAGQPHRRTQAPNPQSADFDNDVESNTRAMVGSGETDDLAEEHWNQMERVDVDRP